MFKKARIYPNIIIENRKTPIFEGVKKYFSTGGGESFEDGYEMVTFENRPTRANLSPLINDVLIAKMKGAEKVILIDEDKTNYIFSTGFFPITSKELLPKYLYYLFSNYEFNEEKDNFSVGTTQQAINIDHFKKINITYTQDKKTQKEIINLLDKKIKGIDDLVKIQIKQIEKLEDYKKAIISKVIKRGLLAQENLIDSGIDWIGKISNKVKMV